MIMAIDDHVFYLQQEWGIESQPKTVEQPALAFRRMVVTGITYATSCRHRNISKPADNKPVGITTSDSRIPVRKGPCSPGAIWNAKPLTESP